MCIRDRQRPDQPRTAGLRPFGKHPGGTADARSAQQAEEDGLGLIIAVMGQRQPVGRALGEHRMAQTPCRRFQPLTAGTGYFDANDVERHTIAATERGAESGPGVGIGTQAVMDMNRREIEGQSRRAQAIERVQQHDRVAATGQADAQACSRRQASGQERRKSLLDLVYRCRPRKLSACLLYTSRCV